MNKKELEARLLAAEKALATQNAEIIGLKMKIGMLESKSYGPIKEYPQWPVHTPQPIYYGPNQPTIGDPIKSPFEVTCGVVQGKG